MKNIHPTAIIAPGAVIGENVSIGAYSVIGEDCVIGDNCVIDAHVKIAGHTSLGRDCRVYFGAVVGDDPQDHRFKPGVLSHTRIGDSVTLREYVTIHRSPFENGLTAVGDRTLLMAFVHVGHDARIGRNVTVANNSVFAGHVTVDDGAVISAYVLVHQFCRIGKLAMIGGRTLVRQDVPDFCMLSEDNTVCGMNVVGLRRAGFDDERRLRIKKIIKTYFFRKLNSAGALGRIKEEYPQDPDAAGFIEFVINSKRGIMPGNPAMAALGSNPGEEKL
ncbi:MAG: acyl-ACP--UDP-N-acetylglucosamine O-acyltransferase [Lentisphaerae bacterium]|nr:acyl-ACP--UDP-N-acetylglucosamine O-acyltransferase [Lentisphaerota bacterium]